MKLSVDEREKSIAVLIRQNIRYLERLFHILINYRTVTIHHLFILKMQVQTEKGCSKITPISRYYGPEQMHIKDSKKNLFLPSPNNEITILALHGFVSDEKIWVRMIECFEEKQNRDVRIIRPDTLGYGKSLLYDKHRIGIEVNVKRISDYLEETHAQNVFIVAHSMAGLLGARLAALGDPRYKGIMYVGAVHPNRFELVSMARLLMNYGNFYAGILPFMPSLVTNMQIDLIMANMYHKNKDVTPHSRAAVLRSIVHEKARKGVLDALESETPRTVDMSKITLPAKIIVCEHDQIVPISNSERLKRELNVNAANYVLLNELGHMLPDSIPERLAFELDKFVNEVMGNEKFLVNS